MAQPLELPPPPPDRTLSARIGFPLLGLAACGLAFYTQMLAVLPLGVLLIALGFIVSAGRRQEIFLARVSAASDRASRGRFDEARFLLDSIPAQRATKALRMVIDTMRATLAFYEGNLDAALEIANRAVGKGAPVSAQARIHHDGALAIRAVILASLGQKAAAEADIRRVRTADFRQGVHVARVALAEAILAGRERDDERLARVLREDRSLLFGATVPRERLIARALSRLLATKKVSVYREAAKLDPEPLDGQAEWVAKVAPAAAAYARGQTLGAIGAPPAAVTAEALAAAEKAGPKAKRPWRALAVAVWLVAVSAFAGVYVALSDAPHRPHSEPSVGADTPSAWSTLPIWMGVFAMLGMLGLWVGYRIVNARKLTREISQALELRMRGEHAAARTLNTKLAQSSTLMVAPQAERELSTLAFVAGDFAAAVTHAERGIVATQRSPQALALARLSLLPQLYSELVVALAAAGRHDEAAAKQAQLEQLFPSFSHLARAQFRAALFARVQRGEFEDAAALARTRAPDIFVSLEEELLCDVLRWRARDLLPEGEAERIELESRENPTGRSFLERLAPALLTWTPTYVRAVTAEAQPANHAMDELDDAGQESDAGGWRNANA